MPSRRTVLRGCGLVATGGLGWVVGESRSATGEVKRKYIDVAWDATGRQRHGRVLWSAVAPAEPADEINIEYAPSYVEDAVQSPGEITVDQRMATRLNDEFSDVTYRLGVAGTALGGSGYSVKQVSRDGFTTAHLGETATVATVGDRQYVRNVTRRPTWTGPSEIRTFDFSSRYPTYE
jgi:hypothetical protein